MHNFQLSEEQTMVLETVRKYVQDVAGPQALEHDEHRKFVGGAFAGLAETGMLGAAVGEEAGGAGLGMLSLVVAVEELARGCTSSARLFLNSGGQVAMALEGIDAAADLLGEVLMGETTVSFVGPEWGVTVREEGGGLALDGVAEPVTAATEAAKLLVCAQFEGGEAALLVVPADAAQIEASPSLGFRAAAPGKVVFSAASVDSGALLARGADAEAARGRAALAGNIGGAALAVGSALASVDHARRHTEERIAFGKPLARQQAVGLKLVESTRRALGARHLAWHAARLADLGEDAQDTAVYARLSAIDAAVHAADEAIQVHGGYGFTVEYHVERHYRDAKTLEALEGGLLPMQDSIDAHMAAQA